MGAHYDTYNYPAYWENREYEHRSEVLAIASFLAKIPITPKTIDIGSGFGRLTPHYFYRSKKVVLVDPSKSLLKEAKERLKTYPNIDFVRAELESVSEKFRPSSFDLAILVRVMHHIENPDDIFPVANRLLKKKGYFILEFPNKLHGKALLINFLKGNFTYPLDIFHQDKRPRKRKKKQLPFYNFHPEIVEEKLKEHNFKIIEKRSVSNIRSPFLKKYIPLPILVFIEKNLQRMCAAINFGPSIFILAQKA